jgi:hypothetical protein
MTTIENNLIYLSNTNVITWIILYSEIEAFKLAKILNLNIIRKPNLYIIAWRSRDNKKNENKLIDAGFIINYKNKLIDNDNTIYI